MSYSTLVNVMPDGSEPAILKVLNSISAVPASDWDTCAVHNGYNPFTTHAYLLALEVSGSATKETGWQARHLVLEGADGRILGVVPLYLKTHSYGEYVFDWSWAEAYERAGGSYYPKLQSAVPFTPATGPRLLIHPDAPKDTQAVLAQGLIDVAKQLGVSSLHVTFPKRAEWDVLGQAGFLERTGEQFHWLNHGYQTFDDFLGALTSRKRKAIKKERRAVGEAGVTIVTLEGTAITETHWDTFYRFYRATSDLKWGQAYLTRNFFSEIGRTMSDATVLMLAEKDGDILAGALNFRGADTLYGRWWGATAGVHVPFLHFELCYYQAVDYAINHGLARVEAGAQGTHKLARGYMPTETFSAHWIRDGGFANAVQDFLDQERRAVSDDIGRMAALGPFRRDKD